MNHPTIDRSVIPIFRKDAIGAHHYFGSAIYPLTALSAATECQEAWLEAILATGGLPLIGDPFASGSVLGPAHFRDLAGPGLSRLVDLAHDAGSAAAIHVCGDTNPILDALLSTGADLFHLEEADLDRAAASGAVLMGGVPTEVLIGNGDTSIEGAVREGLARIPDRERFIFATVCDVPTHAPPGKYTIYMGLFRGPRRQPMRTESAHDAGSNRVRAAIIEIY